MQGQKPKGMQDFRPIIDDPTIDVICIGTPDHWHAIPTILGCQAGKDIYVEKPDGHNIVEGQRMVEAMRKHKRIVQMGSQHRSTTRLQTAMQFCREGGIGRCLFAKGWVLIRWSWSRRGLVGGHRAHRVGRTRRLSESWTRPETTSESPALTPSAWKPVRLSDSTTIRAGCWTARPFRTV